MRERRLNYIRVWARTARQYFNAHEPQAGELAERSYLEKVEFLLAVIDELERTTK